MVGGVASIVVGYLTANLLGRFLAERDNGPIAVTLDFRILAVAGAITMLALLVFGLFPAWRGSRMARGNWVRSGAGNVGFAPTRKRAARRLMVIMRMAMSVVLVMTGGTFSLHLLAIPSSDLGFDRRNM